MNKDAFKPITVLGIDASLTGTGLCLLTLDFINNKVLKSTTLKNDLTGVPRLLYIEEKVKKWAENADIAVIENYAYEKKYNREALAELQGVLKRRLFLMNKELVIVNTQKVKKILTGEPTKPKNCKLAIKQWIMKETLNYYGIDFENRDNECDAFGLALIGLYLKIYREKPEFITDNRIKSVIYELINPKKKYSKKTITYYYNLPYRINVIKKSEGIYVAVCPGLDFSWTGSTSAAAYEKAIKGKKERIKYMKENKIKFKTAAKYMGKPSFTIYKENKKEIKS